MSQINKNNTIRRYDHQAGYKLYCIVKENKYDLCNEGFKMFSRGTAFRPPNMRSAELCR